MKTKIRLQNHVILTFAHTGHRPGEGLAKMTRVLGIDMPCHSSVRAYSSAPPQETAIFYIPPIITLPPLHSRATHSE